MDLGTLLLSIGLKTDDFYRDLERAKTQVQQAGRQMEQSMMLGKTTRSYAQTVIRPKVDLTEVHELNAAYKSKRDDHKQTADYVAHNAITPKVDLTGIHKLNQEYSNLRRSHSGFLGSMAHGVDALDQSLEKVEERISRIRSGGAIDISVNQSVRQNDLVKNENKGLAEDIGRSVEMGIRRANTSNPSRSGKQESSTKDPYRFDTRGIESRLETVIDRLEAVQKETKGVGVIIHRSSKDGFIDTILKIPAKIATGALEGLGSGLTMEYSKGISEYLEGKSGRGFHSMGKSSARYVYGRSKGFGEVIAQGMGYEGGLRGVSKDVRVLTKAVDDFLNPKKFVQKLKHFEDELVKVLEDLTVYNKPDRASQRVREYFKPDAEYFQEAGLRAAGVGLRVGAQPLRVRKRVRLAKSAMEAEEMAGSIEISPEAKEQIDKSRSISIVTGGIDFQKGGVNTDFAENLVKRILPDSYTQKVYNPYSNDKETLGTLYEMRKAIAELAGLAESGEPMPLDRLLQVVVEKGFNPDAIVMAAQAIAFRNQFPDKPINLLGTSGGSFVVEEAISILERAGVKNVQGVGLTAPMAGLTGTASKENFRSIVGDLDPLYLAMFGGKGVSGDPEKDYALKRTMEEIPVKLPGLISPTSPYNRVVPGAGIGHALLQFLAEPKTQDFVAEALAGNISSIPEEFTGKKGIQNLDFLRIKNDEAATLPRTLKAVFGDQPTIEQIRENQSQGALGYSFFDPLHPDWRRDADLKSMMKTVAKKGKRVSPGGETAAEFDQYNDFLGELSSGLTKFYESGGKAKNEMIAALGKGSAIYSELQSIVDQVARQLEEYSTLLLKEQSISADDVWGDDRTPKEAYKDRQRIERLRSQYGDNPSALLSLLKSSQSESTAEYQQKVQAAIDSRMPKPPDPPAPPPQPIPTIIPEIAKEGELIAAEPPPDIEGNLLQRMAKKASNAVANKVKQDLETVREAIDDQLVANVNDQLMRVPGRPDIQNTEAAQIGDLSEIGWREGLQLTRIGVEDSIAALKQAGSTSIELYKQAVETMNQIKSGIDSVIAILPGNRNKGKQLQGQAQGDLEQLKGVVDQSIGQIPPGRRMSEGASLAGLKGNISQEQKRLQSAERQIVKSSQIAEEAIQAIEQLAQMQSQVSEVVDAEIIEESQIKALPAAASQTQEEIRGQMNAVIDRLTAQIKDVGQVFSQQNQSLSNENLSDDYKIRIASGLAAMSNDARAAIDAVLEPFGDQIPRSLKEAAKSTRIRVTKAETKATGTLNANPELTQRVEESDAQLVGGNFTLGIHEGLLDQIEKLEESARKLGSVVTETLKDEWDIRSPSQVAASIGGQFVQGLAIGLGLVGGGAGVFKLFEKQITGFVDNLKAKFGQAGDALGKAFNFVKVSVAWTAAFRIFSKLFDVLSNIAPVAIDNALEFNRFERALTFVSGSAQRTQETMDSLRESANRLGVDLRASLESRAQIQAAARGTILEGLGADEIDEAVDQASAVYGLNAEQTGRVGLAIQQMVSKGKVQAEELRQQLGEVLPGAMQIFARSLGVTTQQMDKMLERGEVGIDAVVRFAAQLKAETATGVDAAANSASASINRMNNAIYELQVAFGQMLLPAQGMGMDLMVGSLQTLQKLLPVVTAAVSAFALQVGFDLTKSVYNAVAPFINLQGALLNLPATLAKVGTALKSLIATIAPVIAKFAVFFAVIDSFKVLGEMNRDLAGATRSFADAAGSAVDRYREAVGKAVDETKKLADAIKSLPQSYGENTGMGSLIKFVAGEESGTQFIRQREQDIAKGGGSDAISDILRLFGVQTGRAAEVPDGANASPFAFIPRSEKAAQDTIVASDEGLSEVRKMIADARGLVVGVDRGVGRLNEAKELDIKMRDLMVRRSMLPSDDVAGRRDIDNQYAQLQSEYNTTAAPVRALQGDIAAQIEFLKGSRDRIKEALEDGGLNPATARKLTGELIRTEAALKNLETTQDSFNKALNIAIEGAASLASKFADVAFAMERTLASINLNQTQASTQLLQQQLSGQVTPGQAQYGQNIIDQSALTQTLSNLDSTIASIEQLLTSPAISRALSFAGLEANADAFAINSKISELERGGADPESEEFKILTQARDQRLQIEGLTQQRAQAERELAQNQLQAQEALRDTTRQIREFFKSVQRETQDLALATREAQLEVKAIDAQNKLKEGIRGFSNKFFGDFIGNILGVVDKIFEAARNAIQGDRQILGIQQGFQDRIQQAGDLQRGAYGGAAGSGVAVGSGLVTGPAGAIGAGAEYHIDSKFNRSLGMPQIVELFDQMAVYYASQNRQIEFSNAAVAGEVYRLDDPNRQALLERAFAAHHSQDRDAARGVYSVDYYIPQVGGNRFDDSVVGAEIAIPTIPSGRAEFASGGGYGNYVNLYDAQGNLVMQTGHGDSRQALPNNFSFGGSTAPRQAASTASTSAPQGAAQLSEADIYRLATMAIFESPTTQGRVDVAHNIFNRINDPQFPNDVSGVIFQPNQYEPASRYGLNAENTGSRSGALNALIRAGYSERQAQEALDSTLSAFADPAMNASARDHVGGRLYFKGTSMQGNMRPGDRLRSPDENFFHDEGESQAYMQNLASQAPTAIVASGVSVPGGQSISIDPAISQAGANAQQSVQNVLDTVAARDRQTAIELQQQIDGLTRGLEQGVRGSNQNVLAEQRRQQDAQLSMLPDTPENQLQRQRIDAQRQLEDAELKFKDDIRELEEAVLQLEHIRGQIATMPELAEVLPGLDAAIESSKGDLDQLNQLFAEERNLYESRIAFIEETQERERKARELQNRQRSIGIDNQLLGILAQSERLSGRGMQAVGFEGIAQAQQIRLDYDVNLAEFEELLRLGQISEEEFEKLKSTIEQIRDISLSNLTEQLRQQQDELQRSNYNQLFDSKQNLGNAMLERYRLFGSDNPELGRQLAIGQQNMSFQNQIAEIDRMVESGQLFAETAATIKQNLIELNELQLSNIETQFDPLVQGLGFVKDGFQSLVAQMLTGSASIGDILQNMANQFANLASQLLMNELFNMILGDTFGLGGFLGSGGGTPGWLQAATSAVSLFSGGGIGGFLGFKDGGMVGGASDFNDIRSADNAIGKALRKEGTNSVLATLTEGELVLTTAQARRFYEMGLDRVIEGYRDGGVVGGRKFSTPQMSIPQGGGDVSVNVPITIEGGADKASVDERKLQEGIRGAIVEELIRQKAPGGALYR
jgi:tape measure domain-containing protein